MRLHRHNQKNGELLSASPIRHFWKANSRPFLIITALHMRCKKCGDLYSVELEGEWTLEELEDPSETLRYARIGREWERRGES